MDPNSAKELIQSAREVASRAYCPYSDFPVGAALEAEDGQVFVGCNVENASYPLTLCAERSALAAAVSQGVRRFRRIAIVGGTEKPAAPCGACRQMLFEFAPDLEVFSSVHGEGETRSWNLRQLLMDGFGPSDLQKRSGEEGE